ncbi:TadE family type IV pilus minor pilin [Gordonia sp. NPDC003950]
MSLQESRIRCRWLRRLITDEVGMVTVEAAYGISAIIAILILGLGVIGAVVTEIRCTDAAREVARLTASGDAQARSAATDLVGGDARISVNTTDVRIVVEVTDDVPMLPGVSMTARAVAVPEPDGSDQVEFAPGVRP